MSRVVSFCLRLKASSVLLHNIKGTEPVTAEDLHAGDEHRSKQKGAVRGKKECRKFGNDLNRRFLFQICRGIPTFGCHSVWYILRPFRTHSYVAAIGNNY